MLAVDVPSGLDADQAGCWVRVQATVTVTLADPKPGYSFIAAGRAGRVVVAGIGMPAYAYQGERIKGSLLTGPSVREWLPLFAPDTHKGQRGRVYWWPVRKA